MGSYIQCVAAAQSVPANGAISLGSAPHQGSCGCGRLRLEGDGVACRGRGACEVSAAVTLKPSEGSGIVSVSLMQDGAPLPGGTAAASVGNEITLPVHAVAYNDSCGQCVVTLVNTGLAADIENVSLVAKALSN